MRVHEEREHGQVRQPVPVPGGVWRELRVRRRQEPDLHGDAGRAAGGDGIRRVRQPDFVPPAGPGREREVHDDVWIYDGGETATPAQDHGNAGGREGMVQPRQLWQRDCAEGAGGQWNAEDADGDGVHFAMATT